MKFSDVERDAKIVEMRKSGMSFEDIGRCFGLSKQRIHQIFFLSVNGTRNGIEKRAKRNEEITNLYNASIPIAEIALILNLSTTLVEHVVLHEAGGARVAKKYRKETIKRMLSEGADKNTIVKAIYGIDLTSLS
jgi:DNA-binding CsgD family transcriptional regulator